MFTETANVPTNALSTDHLTKPQFEELCQLTRETWLTPVQALTKDEVLELSLITTEVVEEIGGYPIPSSYYI